MLYTIQLLKLQPGRIPKIKDIRSGPSGVRNNPESCVSSIETKLNCLSNKTRWGITCITGLFSVFIIQIGQQKVGFFKRHLVGPASPMPQQVGTSLHFGLVLLSWSNNRCIVWFHFPSCWLMVEWMGGWLLGWFGWSVCCLLLLLLLGVEVSKG